jgi:hypothetical protein
MQLRRKSAVQPVSPRKLNLLARQITGLPIDEAIVQMQFSHKKASKWIERELIEGRNRAVESSKAMDRSKLVVGMFVIDSLCPLQSADTFSRGICEQGEIWSKANRHQGSWIVWNQEEAVCTPDIRSQAGAKQGREGEEKAEQVSVGEDS